MKKILSLGIASAVLAMTALSASALTIRCDDPINTGATVKVDFVLDTDAPDVSFTVVASGLSIETASIPNASGFDQVRTDKMGLTKMTGGKAGDVVFTQTYKVTAKEGEAISVTVVADTAANTVMSATPLTLSVKPVASTDTSSTASTASTASTTSTTSTTSTASTTSNGGTSTTNPNTGIALAVFPAVIAGAAVVVAKKKRG